MRIEKLSLNGSAFIGVFGAVTEKIGLFPHNLSPKEEKKIRDVLELEVVKCSVAGTRLIGAMVKGNSRGFIVPESAEKTEIRALEEKGLKVKAVEGLNALGNLVALNDFGCIVSPLLPGKKKKEIESFFRLTAAQESVAKNEVAGASVVATNRGFLVNPNADREEFKLIEQTFKVPGAAATANYGDVFVANDVLANSKGVLIGSQTSGHEIIRIDEGLRGE